MRALLWLSGILSLSALAADAAVKIGDKPPEWDFKTWVSGDPLTLAKLRGKVVLVRWWTAPQCPFCKNTAPALNTFYEDYHARGLEVVGVYHHKMKTPFTPDDVKQRAEAYAFKFPIAIDDDWSTLNRWWMVGDTKDKWTSVTFLIGRDGAIKHIHPGGQYVKGDGEYELMEKKILEALNEK